MDATRKLQLLFKLPDASCVQWDGDEMHGESGFLSFRRRAKVQVGNKKLDVFVKISDSSRDDMGDFTDTSVSACRRECMFFSVLAPILSRSAQQHALDTVLPHVHHEMLEDNQSVLVMEDLSSQGFCAAPPIMSLQQIHIVLRSLAMLQAAFCISRHRLGQYELADWMLGVKSPLLDFKVASEFPYEAQITENLPAFLQKLPQLVDADRKQVIEAYMNADCVSKVMRAMQRLQEADSSLCLAHWDLWYNNCMLRGSECRLLDWQFPSVGRLGCDTALLLTSSADNSFAASQFLDCVDFYHETLQHAFETRTGAKFPVSQQQVRDNAVEALHVAAGWNVLALAGGFYSDETLANSLRNLADLLQRFRL